MTALAINDLSINNELDSAALNGVAGGQTHFSRFYYGRVQTGNWGRWVYRGMRVLGSTFKNGKYYQVRKYSWSRARVQTQAAWRYGYID